MLPIRDRNPSGLTPYVTWGLIVINVAVFLSYWPLGTDESVNAVFRQWGMVPSRLSAGQGLVTIFTAMFVHGGWLHLALNMLFLRIFGDNLEAEMGHLRFLGFYLVTGLVAFFLQFVSAPFSPVPVAGASGAVAGVMGGYVLMFPRAKVDLLFYYVVGLRAVPVPAWGLLGLWFLLQVLGGLSAPAGGAVAFWAHVGGFLAGIAFSVRLWRMRGARTFWRRYGGRPPHPTAKVEIPVVRRRGSSLPPPQPSGLFRRDGASRR
ncbi:MAG: rhomboid family intramembrane serine protease [Rhodobacter sp.]|uniref:rhomboid family intramembrane serine protease n=1 Tax=Pararhodobacter sp. TaxID=2127056 RepID=UPI001D59FB00|nr:rhomboid family intramembrane serine protease [Pararhodobacter sp.]MCB1344316.1 rhomboid family intramembrane serine protease [Paracoccaceae bacterium]MCC0071687.1 rhomboid family intramembrane serine protease [Rhodobacter sp.]HPD93405.1 rhomboid family intramembrane serine protease [Pararhodobacter sp.]